MRKSLLSSLVLFLALSGFGLAAFAADKYEVDNLHSSVLFKVRHAGLSNFYGRFNRLAGAFEFDEKDANKCTVNVEVLTGSVDTNDAKRDKHLKGPDFFNAVQFPKMTFKSKSVKKLKDKHYEITGELTFHGVTKEIKAKAEHIATKTNSRGQTKCGFEIHFEIKRSDFGVKYGIPGIGDDVAVTVSMEALKK
jgi:polyisoprenoid-binding protein YceI